MNNKGFAITGILYGLMIMFILILLSFLSVLSSKKNRLEKITDSIYDNISYNDCSDEDFSISNNISTNNIISSRSIYYFKINDSLPICSVYLPADSYIYIENNKLMINYKENKQELILMGCSNESISSVTIIKICK